MNPLVSALLLSLSHNDNHFIRMTVGGRTYPLCTRCSGMLLGVAVSIPVAILAGLYAAPGPIVAGISLALFLPDLSYWALTRVNLLPDLNTIRVLNGFLLGAAIVGYGQAQLNWGVKLAIPALILIVWNLAHVLIGRWNI